MPRLTKKEELISLEQLKKKTTKEELTKTLGAKYDEAVRRFVAGISDEAKKMMKAKSKPQLLRELADRIENAKYLEITITELRYVPKNIPKEYLEKIDGLLAEAEELTASEILRGIADIAEEAEQEGIMLIPKLNIKPNAALVSEVKNTKGEFVDDVSTIISSGLNGKTTEPFSITFDDEKTAELFYTALKEIGLQKPETEARIPFKDAFIAKGKYPLEVRQKGKTVAISWPEWLAVGKSYLANTIPEKINRR